MRNIWPLWVLILSLCLAAGTASAAETADCKTLQGVFKGNVKQQGPICSVHISRDEIKQNLMGVNISPAMVDIAFGANFQKAEERYVVTGEFALLSEEVNPVIDALRKGGILVSAVHNHTIGEQPPILYLHFQGIGQLEPLANTVKAAMKAATNK